LNKPFFTSTKDLFGNEIIPKKKKEKNPCEKCGLKNKSEYSYYNEKSDILVIIDYYNQDISYIKEKLQGVKYNLTFALQCENQNNITVNQINSCRNNLKKVIEELKPKKILTFGLNSLQGLIGDKISVTDIETFAGWQIPDQDYKCFIFPNFYLKNNENIILNKKFEEYLYQALNYNRKFKNYDDYKNYIHILKDKNKVIEFLKSIKDNDIIIFDYETNSLRSMFDNSKIICMSICKNNKTYAFPIFLDEKFILELKSIFENEKIFKIAHNINFENSWTKNYFKSDIKNWFWDTMLCSHVLDNRRDITGLKFQIYINFGVVGYDDNISFFFKSDGYYNSIQNADIDELLLYCGIDSYFTNLLYQIQKRQIDNDLHLKKGFYFFMEGLRNLLDIHLNGIKFDNEVYEKNYNELTEKINVLHNKIMNSNEVKKWKGIDFNYNSSKQLRELLFDICKWKSKGNSKTGLNSVDAVNLKLYNKEFTNNILEKRQLTKMRDTYLSQFKREEINGFLYPIFNLHTVSSFRPSTSFPNMANVPKRNEIAKDMIRETIIAKNDRLIEIDYSGIEVMMAACYTKDSNLINYILDENTDMHRDTAADIFCIHKNEVTKELRYLAKNKFVFPQFYGDYYVNCSNNIWQALNIEQKELLKSKGFLDKRLFEEHIKKVENIFWNERFKEYNEWKKNNYNNYLEKGYIEFNTGFRATGIMRRNQVNNLVFQGSAFHVLLWSLCKINKYLKENNYKTQIVNQIYDCIVFDSVDSEWNKLKPVIKKIMLEDVRKYYEWIIIPLKAEVTYYGKNWADEIKSEML
jgi:DNA polymerase-1